MKKIDRFRRLVLKAIYKGHAGGLEGISFSELVAYMRLRIVFRIMERRNTSVAEKIHVVRVCQGEIEDKFVDTVLGMVNEFMQEGLVVVSEEALIFITAKGRQAYLKDGIVGEVDTEDGETNELE